MTIQPNSGPITFPIGNMGIGTTTPNTRLTLSGGPAWTSNSWTASMNMQNGAAMGWEVNSSGQRFGVGQSNGGLYFFRTNSAFGTTGSPANYDLQITDNGNLIQPSDKSGLVKAMLHVDGGGTIIRCYNGVTGNSTYSGNTNTGCGFVVGHSLAGIYSISFDFPTGGRFPLATTYDEGVDDRNSGAVVTVGPTSVSVRTFVTSETFDSFNKSFFLVVF